MNRKPPKRTKGRISFFIPRMSKQMTARARAFCLARVLHRLIAEALQEWVAAPRHERFNPRNVW
jgi:hypothetical protein